MINSISKAKVPPGLAYALQTSQLEKALADAKLDYHINLRYHVPYRSPRKVGILYAHYQDSPEENVTVTRIYVSSCAIDSSLRRAASDALLAVALPQFIEWIFRVRALPDNSTAWFKLPSFNATYSEDGLEIRCQPENEK